MSSAAERRRRRRARSAAQGEAVRAQRAKSEGQAAASSAKPKTPKRSAGAAAAPGKRETGLTWLLEKQRLTPRQARVGERFGAVFRAAAIEGGESLRSCLDISPRAGGGSGLPPSATAAEWIARAREQLAGAYMVLGHHPGLMTVCELICGHGLRPREITTVQRESEEIETALRLALDLLEPYFAGLRESE